MADDLATFRGQGDVESDADEDDVSSANWLSVVTVGLEGVDVFLGAKAERDVGG